MKNVLVNGGSRGIGKEMVKLFSSNGYSVAFTYKSSDECAKALSEETGAFAIKADSNVPADIDRAVSSARDLLGSIDVLINNAGIAGFSMFSDITLDMWYEMLNTNLTSAFLYTQKCLPDMVHGKWGRIINISSMWGITGSSCEVHYSTAKAGLIGMTKALALEVGEYNICVNCISPGAIERCGVKEEHMTQLGKNGRSGTPKDIAETALFLAYQDYITGENIIVDGGRTLGPSHR